MAGPGARSISYRQRVWAVRGDDGSAVRDRVSGEPRWDDVDAVSLSVQAAGSQRASGHLRAVPAAVRLESLVRVVRSVATVAVGGERADAARGRKPECARALPLGPVQGQSAAARTDDDLSLLVHR